jgi:hypothetical protein
MFPILRTILVHVDIEFEPYSLQLLARLIKINQPLLPTTYMYIFQIFSTSSPGKTNPMSQPLNGYHKPI